MWWQRYLSQDHLVSQTLDLALVITPKKVWVGWFALHLTAPELPPHPNWQGWSVLFFWATKQPEHLCQNQICITSGKNISSAPDIHFSSPVNVMFCFIVVTVA